LKSKGFYIRGVKEVWDETMMLTITFVKIFKSLERGGSFLEEITVEAKLTLPLIMRHVLKTYGYRDVASLVSNFSTS
jgi:hypothetical protein